MVVLYAARHKVPVPFLARWLPGLGIAATLTANMAQGWSHGLVGAVVAAWPAASLVGSYELSDLAHPRLRWRQHAGRRQRAAAMVRSAMARYTSAAARQIRRGGP